MTNRPTLSQDALPTLFLCGFSEEQLSREQRKVIIIMQLRLSNEFETPGQNNINKPSTIHTKPDRKLQKDHRQPLLPMKPATLSLDFGMLPIVPESRTAWLPLGCRISPMPMVVRRLVLFMTGAVRGLKTLEWNAASFWLVTIRRAWLAVNIFSFGGEPAIVAAVGLRRRWVRAESDIGWTCEAREMDPARFKAIPILALSERSTCQFSFSEEELLPLSVELLSTASMMCKEDRFATFPASMVRSGEGSVSDELSSVSWGGGGEPSDFLERKPAWKRFAFGLSSIDGSGAAGVGEEPSESFETSPARYAGRLGSTTLLSKDEISGVESIFWGVFSKSAKAPDSVSSRHRTLRFDGDFFFGVNEMPFFTITAFLRLGDDFMGEE
jgi:hypothetical protein